MKKKRINIDLPLEVAANLGKTAIDFDIKLKPMIEILLEKLSKNQAMVKTLLDEKL
jgi:hypothetical protein